MACVICPQCSGRFHETTEAYLPGVVTTGNMLRLKGQYRDNGWMSFPEQIGMSFGCLECPDCGGAYSDDGRVRIDLDQYDAEQRAKVPGPEQGRIDWPGTQAATVPVEPKKQGRPKKQ